MWMVIAGSLGLLVGVGVYEVCFPPCFFGLCCISLLVVYLAAFRFSGLQPWQCFPLGQILHGQKVKLNVTYCRKFTTSCKLLVLFFPVLPVFRVPMV